MHPAAPGQAAGGAQQRVPFFAGQPDKPGSLDPGRDVDLREQHLGGAVAAGGERGELGQRGFLVVGEPQRESGLEARIILPAQFGGAGRAGAEHEEQGDEDEEECAWRLRRRGPHD